MIVDRTAKDVELAKTLRTKIQANQSLNETEISALERGSCTVNMLNRVEAKQAELEGILNEYAYMVHIDTKSDWQAGDIFKYTDHQRLLNNLNILKQAFFTYNNTPATPIYMYGYNEANSIEKILVDIETMINSMKNKFRECGTFQCGEENNL